MMKRKNWKKTAAFVTSLTMATTMMPAELSSIIVHADPVAGAPAAMDDSVAQDGKSISLDTAAAQYVTAVKTEKGAATVSNYSASAISSDVDKKFELGDGATKVTVNSRFPLNIYKLYKSDDQGVAVSDTTFGYYNDEGTPANSTYYYKGIKKSDFDALAKLIAIQNICDSNVLDEILAEVRTAARQDVSAVDGTLKFAVRHAIDIYSRDVSVGDSVAGKISELASGNFDEYVNGANSNANSADGTTITELKAAIVDGVVAPVETGNDYVDAALKSVAASAVETEFFGLHNDQNNLDTVKEDAINAAITAVYGTLDNMNNYSGGIIKAAASEDTSDENPNYVVGEVLAGAFTAAIRTAVDDFDIPKFKVAEEIFAANEATDTTVDAYYAANFVDAEPTNASSPLFKTAAAADVIKATLEEEDLEPFADDDEALTAAYSIEIEDGTHKVVAQRVDITPEANITFDTNNVSTYSYVIDEGEAIDYDLIVELSEDAAIDAYEDIHIAETKYIKSLTLKSIDGKEYTENFRGHSEYTTHAVYGDIVTIKSTALLDFDSNEAWDDLFVGVEDETTHERPIRPVCFQGKNKTDGLYEYTFTVLNSDIAINTATVNVTLPDNEAYPTVVTLADSKTPLNTTNGIVAGLKYKVVVSNVDGGEHPKSVNISGVATSDIQTTIEPDTENGHENNKIYTSELTTGYEDVVVEVGEHIHQRVYSAANGKLYVECTAPEKDIDKTWIADVEVDYGKEVEGKFTSSKDGKGNYVYDKDAAVKVEININTNSASVSAPVPGVENARYSKYVYNIDDATYAPVVKYSTYDTETKKWSTPTEDKATVKTAGKHKAIVEFTTSAETRNNVADTEKQYVEVEFTVQQKSITNERITFALPDNPGVKYEYNETTKTYQVYSDGTSTIRPVISVDDVPIKNFDNGSPYYAVGTTSAKYPNEEYNSGKPYVISLISKDPNNTTNGDMKVEWEIIGEPSVCFNDSEDLYEDIYYGDSVQSKIVNGITSAHTTYELFYLEGDIPARYIDHVQVGEENRDVLKALPEGATKTVPVNAGDYTVIARYVKNQKTVYTYREFTVKPMPIAMEVVGATPEIDFGGSQTAARAIVRDVYGNDISDIVKKRFVKQPVIEVYKDGALYNGGAYSTVAGTYEVGEYDLKVILTDGVMDSGNKNYTVDPDYLNEADQIAGHFTVRAKEIADDFTRVTLDTDVAAGKEFYEITPANIADAYNAKYDATMQPGDIEIIGGHVTARNITGQIYKVAVEFTNNFRTSDGKSKVLEWRIGTRNPVDLTSFEPEYREDLKACTVVATVEKLDTNAAIKEWGLLYDNAGKVVVDKDMPIEDQLAEAKAQLTGDFDKTELTTTKIKKQAAKNVNSSSIKVTMANSFVNRDVYAVSYVVYEDGTVEFGDCKTSNYFDLVFAGLKVEYKGSFVNVDKTTGKETPCVELNIKRSEAKGYTVADFGYVYSNTGIYTSPAGAQRWLDLDNKDTVNCKIAHVKDGANTLSYTAKIANSKYDSTVDPVNAVYVYAKAFVTVKDKSGDTKTIYTNINGNLANLEAEGTTGIFHYIAE